MKRAAGAGAVRRAGGGERSCQRGTSSFLCALQRSFFVLGGEEGAEEDAYLLASSVSLLTSAWSSSRCLRSKRPRSGVVFVELGGAAGEFGILLRHSGGACRRPKSLGLAAGGHLAYEVWIMHGYFYYDLRRCRSARPLLTPVPCVYAGSEVSTRRGV